MGKKLNLIVGLSLILLVSSFLAGKCGVESSCSMYKLFAPFSFSLFEPIYIYSLISLPGILLAYFVKPAHYKLWARFSFGWILISLFIILITPVTTNTWIPLYAPNKEMVTWLMAGLYTLISLIVLAWSRFSKKS